MAEMATFYLLVLVYALTSGYGLYMLKASNMVPSITLVAGVFAYGLGFVIWLWTLKRYDLSIAFPVAAGALMIASQFFGRQLGEAFTGTKFVGILFIIAGSWILSSNR